MTNEPTTVRRPRRVRLERHRAADGLSITDVRAFLDEYADYDPELVDVTFEVADPVRDHS